MPNIFDTAAYKLIQEHYGDQTTKRSGVKLINHIHEGLMILDFLFIDFYDFSKHAYCLHPLFQSDSDLLRTYKQYAKTFSIGQSRHGKLDGTALLLVMEYRNIANQYLSHRSIKQIEEIQLSPLFPVNAMLIADKVQNRKDFELYHEGTHPRSAELKQYFKNWLARLGVTERQYQYWKTALINSNQWQFLPNLSNGNGAENELIAYVFKDTTTKGRFKIELINATYQLLQTVILEYEEGGYRIDSNHPNTSGYWQTTHFLIGTFINGESYRGMKADWQIDFSKWMNEK